MGYLCYSSLLCGSSLSNRLFCYSHPKMFTALRLCVCVRFVSCPLSLGTMIAYFLVDVFNFFGVVVLVRY